MKNKRYVIKVPAGETLGTVLVGLCEQGHRELEERRLFDGPARETKLAIDEDDRKEERARVGPKKAKRPLRPFLTGSYAYGTPTPASDVDLVVHVTHDDFGALAKVSDARDDSESGDLQRENYLKAGGTSLRFGKLNLIAIQSEELTRVWEKATRRLKAMAPVTRDYAVRYMKRAREKAGFKDA